MRCFNKIVLLLIILSGGFFGLTTTLNSKMCVSQSKTNKEILIQIQNIHTLVAINNYHGLMRIEYEPMIKKTFGLFYKQLLDIEKYATHLNNKGGSIELTQFHLYTRLNNIYNDAYGELDNYQYNNIRLSTLLTPYNPHEIADTLLLIMYDNNITNTQQNKKIHQLLTCQAINHYKNGIKIFTKIDEYNYQNFNNYQYDTSENNK